MLAVHQQHRRQCINNRAELLMVYKSETACYAQFKWLQTKFLLESYLITVQCDCLFASYEHNHLLLHPLNGLFSRTTWISWHQKGKLSWILMKQEMMGWQWHQLDHMQIICTSLQTDNHASTSPLSSQCSVVHSEVSRVIIQCQRGLFVSAVSERRHVDGKAEGSRLVVSAQRV